MVAPYFSNLLTGLISVTLNYAATFYLPSTKLLKDPLETLATAIPILLVGHIVLLVFSLLVMKRCSLRQTLVCFLPIEHIQTYSTIGLDITWIRAVVHSCQLSSAPWIYRAVWRILVRVSLD